MKIPYLITLLALSSTITWAQMPTGFDASGKTAGGDNSSSGNSGSSGSGAAAEPENPKFMGMEIPLLDPSNDTVKYNGGTFDVGNNALVRARFEKYLQQMPDNSSDAKRYRHYMNEIMELTRKSGRSAALVSSATLVKIGRGLYTIADYPGDGGQADALASSMVSVLDAQRANLQREQKNEAIEAEIDKLVKDSNNRNNRNTDRVTGATSKDGKGSSGSAPKRDTVLITANTKDIAELEVEQKANDTANTAAIAFTKVTYQSMLMSMLLQRRFDHCVIGARVYRHLFNDGDTRLKMKNDSKASKFFSDVSGMPPTVNTMDSIASNARRDVDQSMQAVSNMLAQNKLGEATQHLIEAVAIGEFMQSVNTFPTESRQRIAAYWTLRKRLLTSLNARDYGTCEEIAAEMKKLDVDFDDSLVLTYCSGRKDESDLYLRNAKKALMAGDEEKYAEEARKAATVWPRNPNIAKAKEELMKLDGYDPQKAEFKTLLARNDYRTIYKEQDRFEVVAIDPELKEEYKKVILTIATIDAILVQLDSVAKQDKRMGPCVAYETLIEKMQEEPKYGDDSEYKNAILKYENLAHDFISALNDAKDCEARGEIGSALSSYYRAMTIYPKSKLASAGAKRLREIIMQAEYD